MEVWLKDNGGTTRYWITPKHCAIDQFVAALKENIPDWDTITITIVNKGDKDECNSEWPGGDHRRRENAMNTGITHRTHPDPQMKYSAVKNAKSFAATYAVMLSTKQHERFVSALAILLAEAYNSGYTKGSESALYDDSGVNKE